MKILRLIIVMLMVCSHGYCAEAPVAAQGGNVGLVKSDTAPKSDDIMDGLNRVREALKKLQDHLKDLARKLTPARTVAP